MDSNLLLKSKYDCCSKIAAVMVCKTCFKTYHADCWAKIENQKCCGARSPSSIHKYDLPSGSNISEEEKRNKILEDKCRNLTLEVEMLNDKLLEYEVKEELAKHEKYNLGRPLLTEKKKLGNDSRKINIDFSTINVPNRLNETAKTLKKSDQLQGDKSYVDYIKSKNLNNKMFTVISERKGDLFSMAEEYSLACCASQDFHFTKGIGVLFRNKFRETDELGDMHAAIGDVVVLPDKNRFVFYLVSKKNMYTKPTLKSMYRCVVRLRETMVDCKVVKLAIPRLGCGLDGLAWNDIKFLFEYVFHDLKNVQIVVCNV